MSYSSLGKFNESTANYINNVLLGLATNLLGIIVIILFVQYELNKQNEKKERFAENEQIRRYVRILNIY